MHPQAVLQFTLDAIRAHGAHHLIDAPSELRLRAKIAKALIDIDLFRMR
jgi:hypothetical protein